MDKLLSAAQTQEVNPGPMLNTHPPSPTISVCPSLESSEEHVCGGGEGKGLKGKERSKLLLSSSLSSMSLAYNKIEVVTAPLPSQDWKLRGDSGAGRGDSSRNPGSRWRWKEPACEGLSVISPRCNFPVRPCDPAAMGGGCILAYQQSHDQRTSRN